MNRRAGVAAAEREAGRAIPGRWTCDARWGRLAVLIRLAWSAATTVAAAPVTTTILRRQAMEQERATSRGTAWAESSTRGSSTGVEASKPGPPDGPVVRRLVGLPPPSGVEIVPARRSGRGRGGGDAGGAEAPTGDREEVRAPFHPDSRPRQRPPRRTGRRASRCAADLPPHLPAPKRPGCSRHHALDRASGRLLEWTASLVKPPTWVTKAEVSAEVPARMGSLDARSEVSVAIEGGLLSEQATRPDGLPLQRLQLPESMPPPPSRGGRAARASPARHRSPGGPAPDVQAVAPYVPCVPRGRRSRHA